MILGNYHRIVFKPSVSSDLYLYTGTVYRVENYPLEWISGNYYTTYKNNTFEVSTLTEKKTATEYQAVTVIDLRSNDLTTNFTSVLLDKFNNLSFLYLQNNNITILETENFINITFIHAGQNNLTSIKLTNCTQLRNLYIQVNNINALDVSNNPLLKNVYIQNNNLTGEAINEILQQLITNNTTTTQAGVFSYDNVSGINGSLENQLTALQWTLIKL